MSLIRSVARSVVDSWLPGIGQMYRTFRDERAGAAPPAPTPFGFKLAGNSLIASGNFENEEVEVFQKYIREASVCIDIGANIGLYTCLAASKGKRAVAVEPLRANLKLLYSNLISNDFLDVEVYPLGLSSKGGLKQLFGGGTGASFVPGWAGVHKSYNEVVPVTTLDVLTSERFQGQTLFIKMDVEGFENEVLKGAEKTLALSPKPVWLVEVCLDEHFPGGLNPKFRETFETFWRHGYQARVADRGERPVSPDDVKRWSEEGHVDFGSHNYLFL